MNVAQSLAAIARHDTQVNAFTAVLKDRPCRNPAGPLAGMPFAAKNLFDITGIPTLAGSKIRRDAAPAATDATAIARLEAAGAVCVGALNMDEFAYGFTTENTHYGPTRNPHDLTCLSGGSSGGSAASVAAGMVPFSLGTDTNGSIRVPASLCGIWGLKPTYGRLSRAGATLFVASLDHIGPFARDTETLARVYDVMQGPDALDPVQQAGIDLAAPGLSDGIKGLRIGILGGWFDGPQTAFARKAVQDVAQALGATATVNWADAEATRAAAFVITASEGAGFRLPELRTRLEDFEPLIQDRLLAGAMIPAAWTFHAQRVRAMGRDSMRSLMADWDVLIAPATPTPATPIGQEMLAMEGVTMPLRPSMGLYTQPISAIGLPVVAAPIQKVDGALPIGVQIIGRPWQEATLLRVARVLEKSGLCSAPVAPAFAA
ncbi:MAG: AtzE family amidohydrolase [Alphaproteobacteria bacterium]|nr:AtzE family amidohydrolase [Alphaproteobacteria bacterium]